MPQNFNPAIILVHPQIGENIGASARAMMNFGLSELRLVAPRDNWPCVMADRMSAGALDKMPPVQVFDTLADAIADMHHVYATTARPRDMVKPVITPHEAAKDIRTRAASEQKTAILFGAERSGLSNDEISLAHEIITVPLNPDFSSLNLAQGVLICAYEWFKSNAEEEKEAPTANEHIPAKQKDFQDLLTRLEDELDERKFFRSEDMRPTVMRNLTNALIRANMTDQEVRTFHGIISALIGKKIG